MKRFEEVYKKNKELDQVFNNLYATSDLDIVRKNKLELLVELGELANETKCFKYWSNKTADIEKIKEEYADCIIMVLCFFNMLNVSLDEPFKMTKNLYDIVDLIAYLYELSSQFYINEDRELIKQIFVKFIDLGYLLNLSDDDIIKACLSKIKKTYKRLEDGI